MSICMRQRNMGIGMCMMSIINMSMGLSGTRRCLIAMCMHMG